MIGKTNLIQAKDFKGGLYTGADIINPNPDLSPNCMDVQWFFDNSIGKRLGSSTTNSVVITSAGGASGFIVQNSLTNNLIAYWKMEESAGTRKDSDAGDLDLNAFNNPLSTTGIRGNAVNFVAANSQMLYMNTASFGVAGSSFTISSWIYLASTGRLMYVARQNNNPSQQAWSVYVNDTDSNAVFEVLSDGSNSYREVKATSFGALKINSWNNIIAWVSNGLHIGIEVNLSANTALFSGTFSNSGIKTFTIGGQSDATTVAFQIDGRVDEVGIWNRGLSLTERQQLYSGGSGNTYTGTVEAQSWASFDFGASGARWYTVAAGTGIMASSNLGRTFVNIATSRTATYQYLDRSRNVLIATSDAYDQTLYWAGSVGTFAVALAVNSAPKAKFSVNYQGFLVLLNSMDSNNNISSRRFSYADENLQLTSAWPDGFDLPSSSDDEITGPFILNKFLYVSTKYKIFRLNYTGGNPDWEYIQVANFGFVPRTMEVFAIKGNQVAMGLDWTRRMRVFYGFQSDIVSDNVESDNNYCDFAMQKISLVGSGLIISNAEFDPNEQEYRLNVAIGSQSTQTTHAIVLNARTLAMYPYSNQPFNTMCVAESAGRQYLMAVDRSGYAHILNSGNLDVSTPINEIYDTPLLFKNSPSEVTKNKQVNLFFSPGSCGTLYFQERFDFSNVFSPMRPLRNHAGQAEMTGAESSLQLVRTVDLPSVQNIWQGRITSSAGTAEQWVLTHFDLFNTGLGYGRGK